MTHARVALMTPLLLLSACFFSHGADAPPADEPIDDPIDDPIDPAPAPLCRLGDGSISVRVEHVEPAPDTGACIRPDGSIDAVFLGAEPAPRDDGVTLRLDGCPFAFAPCPCAITVGGIGADLAPQIGTLDEGGIVRGHASDTAISLYRDPLCGRCETCSCPPARVILHAEDGPIGSIPSPHSLSVSRGAATCAMNAADDCSSERYELEAKTSWYDGVGPREVVVAADATETVRGELQDEVVALRVLRSDMLVCPDARLAYQPAYALWHEPLFDRHTDDPPTRRER